MTQKTFLVKGLTDKIPSIVEIKTVRHPVIRKTSSYVEIPGIGSMPVRTSTGRRDTSQFEIATTGHWYTVEANKDGVHQKIRRLRQQEAERLDRIDEQIAALQKERVELLKEAWYKANVVTVKELLERIQS